MLAAGARPGCPQRAAAAAWQVRVQSPHVADESPSVLQPTRLDAPALAQKHTGWAHRTNAEARAARGGGTTSARALATARAAVAGIRVEVVGRRASAVAQGGVARCCGIAIAVTIACGVPGPLVSVFGQCRDAGSSSLPARLARLQAVRPRRTRDARGAGAVGVVRGAVGEGGALQSEGRHTCRAVGSTACRAVATALQRQPHGGAQDDAPGSLFQ